MSTTQQGRRFRLDRFTMAASFTGVVAMQFFAAPTATAQDWPGFRGADGHGAVRQSTGLSQMKDARLDAAWKTPIGSGYSGAAIADGPFAAVLAARAATSAFFQ